MPCTELLSEFTAPYKFGLQPCRVSQLDYDTNQVDTITLSTGFTQTDDCAGGIRVYWLNRKGGIDSFVFSGKYEKGLEVSGGKIAVSSSAVEFYYDKGVRRDYVSIVSQPIQRADVPALLTIVYSPWVWVQDGSTSLPVTIEEGGFVYEISNKKVTQVEFRMIYGQLSYTQLR